MTKVPAVSVLMTAYNREAFVGAAIESVLAQTFTDFELIVVDDCSRDRTVEVVRRYLGDPRVRLVVNDHNLGDYPNRNQAARFARGEFLKYHDSDDLMYPHCLDVMVDALRRASDAMCALTCGRGWAGGPCPMLLTPRLAFEREYLGHGLFHAGASGALFRRRAFAEIGGFPEVGTKSDNIFWFSVCAAHNVLLVPGDLFWYRVHDGQEQSGSRAPWDRVDCDRYQWQFIDTDACLLTPEQREVARRNRAFLTTKHLLLDLRQGAWAVAWYRLRRSGLRVSDWLRYVRKPVRDMNAGSPRDERGEFVVPDTMRVQPGGRDAAVR